MPRSVLLVEDDRGILTVLRRFFEKRGWSVLTAAAGARGIDRYAVDRPDLVLLDVELPDMNGLPVLRRLRDLDGEARVIMLTGPGDIETAVEAMRLGADNVVTKPFELDHLAAVIEGQEEDVELRRSFPAELRSTPAGAEPVEPLTLEEVERRHVARVLERTEGNRSQAARVLGISRAALYDKMDRFGLRAVGR